MCGKVKRTRMTQVGEEKAEGKLNHLLGDKEGLSLWGGVGGVASCPPCLCMRSRGNGLRPKAGLRLERGKNLAGAMLYNLLYRHLGDGGDSHTPGPRPVDWIWGRSGRLAGNGGGGPVDLLSVA